MSTESLNHWMEWKKCCAFAKCGTETGAQLASFFRNRLVNYIRALDPSFDLPADPNYAAALFEEKTVAGIRRDGKTYKLWLFSNGESQAEPNLNAVLGRATLLIRDLARRLTFAQRMRAGPVVLSLDQSVGHGEEEIPLGDLQSGSTPDPAFIAWLNEVQSIAREEALRLFADCDERERQVLVARGAGVALTDEEFQQATGLKKTTLFQTLKLVETRVSRQLRRSFPNENPEDFALLTRATFAELVRVTTEKSSGMLDAASLQRTKATPP